MEFVRIGRLKNTLIRGPLSPLDSAKYLGLTLFIYWRMGIQLADVHSATVDGCTEKS